MTFPQSIEKTHATEKPVVLVVDDMPAIVEIYRKSLQQDFKLKVATCGKSAMKAATTAPVPSCILLDVMMPDIDGYAICRKLRSHPTSKSTPIIFVTSKTSKKDETLGFDSGADDFITKPASPELLKSRIEAQLQKNSQTSGDISVEDSLAAAINAFGNIFTRCTPETFQSISEREASMNQLLQDEEFTGDWAVRLAAMIQASLAPDLNDEISQESARESAIDQVNAIPNTTAPAAVFNRFDADAAQSLGMILLKAAEMTAHSQSSPEIANIARDMAVNAVKILQQPEDKQRVNARASKPAPVSKHTIGVKSLKPGMIALENIRTTRGATVIPAKTTITQSMIEHINQMQYNSTKIEEPIVVTVKRKT